MFILGIVTKCTWETRKKESILVHDLTSFSIIAWFYSHRPETSMSKVKTYDWQKTERRRKRCNFPRQCSVTYFLQLFPNSKLYHLFVMPSLLVSISRLILWLGWSPYYKNVFLTSLSVDNYISSVPISTHIFFKKSKILTKY